VSYATGVLSHLRLRAFNRRSSLPSLRYRIARNSVAPLWCETPAAKDYYGRGRVKRSRLLDLLSLTKRRWESKSGCDRHQVIAWCRPPPRWLCGLQDEPFTSWAINLRKRIRSTRHSNRRKPTARLRRNSNRPQLPRRRRERSRRRCPAATLVR